MYQHFTKHYSGYLTEEFYYEIHCNVGRHTAAGLNQYNRQSLWEVDIHYFMLELYNLDYRCRPRGKKKLVIKKDAILEVHV